LFLFFALFSSLLNYICSSLLSYFSLSLSSYVTTSTLGANFHLRNGSALSPLDLAGQRTKDPGEREVLRRHMLSIEPRLRTLILYHQDFLEHASRKPLTDWEGERDCCC
jgi:hypothetical protein